jgi:hypothetical protein
MVWEGVAAKSKGSALYKLDVFSEIFLSRTAILT